MTLPKRRLEAQPAAKADKATQQLAQALVKLYTEAIVQGVTRELAPQPNIERT